MAIDPEQTDVVREALAAADSVDGRGISVLTDGDAVVLQGTVATFEELSAATAVAEQHADVVRIELKVDTNLREGARAPDGPPDAPADEATTGSSFDPTVEPDDMVADAQASLDENVPWDPPHEAVEVPTRAESRGVADRSGAWADDDAELLDEAADPAATSLPETSPQELARAAHPRHDEENG